MSVLDGTPFEALKLLSVEQLRRIDPQTVRSTLDPVSGPHGPLKPCIFGQALATHHILPAVTSVARRLRQQVPGCDHEAAEAAAKRLTFWNDEEPYTAERRAALTDAIAAALREKGVRP